MKLMMIQEAAFYGTVDLIEEMSIVGVSGMEKRLKFRAKLQERDVVNNNGRTYSEVVLQLIVDQLAPKATERKLLGELDHPSPQSNDKDVRLKRSSTISLQNSAVLFTKMEYDGKFIVAECETLTNRIGTDLFRLLKDKVTIGFSLRAFGGAVIDPITKIQSIDPIGLKALTFDVVSNPSHSNAVISEFITESTDISELINNIKILKQVKDDTIEIITESTDNSLTQFNLDGESVCSCDIDGSCVAGTIEESVNYLLDLSIAAKGELKKFNFQL